MARCKHCGELADHILLVHPACEEVFQLGERLIAMEVASAVSAGGDLEGLPSRIATVARESRIPGDRARELVVAGWVRAVEKFHVSRVLDEEEERRLIRLEYLFGLTQADLHASKVWKCWQASAA